MRILRTTLLGLLALGLLGVHGSASAALITQADGLAIEDFSSELTASGLDRLAVDSINGTGLTGGAGVFGAGVHGTASADMWSTNGDFGVPNDTPPAQITYDLGDNYTLSGLHVWNYNEIGQSARGANSVTISVSPTGLTGDLVSLGVFTFVEATGLGYLGAAVPLGSSSLLDNVRLVRFDIATNFGGTDFVGLSEVQFDGVVIPEPSSLLLAGLGMLGLAGYGRRRK